MRRLALKNRFSIIGIQLIILKVDCFYEKRHSLTGHRVNDLMSTAFPLTYIKEDLSIKRTSKNSIIVAMIKSIKIGWPVGGSNP